MNKQEALSQIDAMYTSGFINQASFTVKLARIEQIAIDRSIHYKSKEVKYLAIVTMTNHGL